MVMPKPESTSVRASRSIAAGSPLSSAPALGQQRALVLCQQHEGRARGRAVPKQQMRQQPVGLGGRPAEAVAEARADHARRGGRQDGEIEEDADAAPRRAATSCGPLDVMAALTDV